MQVEQVMFRSGPVRCAGFSEGEPRRQWQPFWQVEDAIDESSGHDRAWEPKRLELLEVDEFGLSIEPGFGRSMGLAAEFFDQHLRRAPLFEPSPPPEEARARGLRPEYRAAAVRKEEPWPSPGRSGAGTRSA